VFWDQDWETRPDHPVWQSIGRGYSAAVTIPLSHLGLIRAARRPAYLSAPPSLPQLLTVQRSA